MQHDNPDDKNVKFWQAYIKTVKPMHKHYSAKPSKALLKKILPLPCEGLEPKISVSISKEFLKNNSVLPVKPQKIPQENNSNTQFAPEKNAKKRMKKGDFIFDAKIDLHGQTQNQAFDNLQHFITKNFTANIRHLLVITGRGRYCYKTLSPMGILIKKVPEWLKSPPFSQMISVIETAAYNDGGEGALYVILRKKC